MAWMIVLSMSEPVARTFELASSLRRVAVMVVSWVAVVAMLSPIVPILLASAAMPEKAVCSVLQMLIRLHSLILAAAVVRVTCVGAE